MNVVKGISQRGGTPADDISNNQIVYFRLIVLEVARLSRVTVSWSAGRVHANPISTP